MNFAQKRGGYRTTFAFGAEALEYTFSARGNRRGGSAPYAEIPTAWRHLQKKSWYVKYIAAGFVAFWLVVGSWVMTNPSGQSPNPLRDGLILMAIGFGAALLILILDRLESPPTRLTIIPGRREIWIIVDGQHQAIVDEIMSRRREALRRKFASIDTLSPPGSESRKFRWLLEEGVISDEAYRDAIARLAAMQRLEQYRAPPPGEARLH